ncbi:hypothetical protein DL95DRAFT_482762 [Leptodontidium sp. 2 PMI_412]|nr:hypothetical protein DL95DRAFT_482762 [Leptodontidium sp. 2 PMI_412]
MVTLDDRDMLAQIDSLQTSNVNDALPTCFIDTRTAVAFLVEALAKLPTSPLSFYLGLEGIALSRHGSVSILRVYPPGACLSKRLNFFDRHPLPRRDSFFATGNSGQTLKGILESDTILKVFFDVRNDSDAAITVSSLLAFMTSNSWNSQHEASPGVMVNCSLAQLAIHGWEVFKSDT